MDEIFNKFSDSFQCGHSYYNSYIVKDGNYMCCRKWVTHVNIFYTYTNMDTRTHTCGRMHTHVHTQTLTRSKVVPTSLAHLSISSMLRRWVEVIPYSSKYLNNMVRCSSLNRLTPIQYQPCVMWPFDVVLHVTIIIPSFCMLLNVCSML